MSNACHRHLRECVGVVRFPRELVAQRALLVDDADRYRLQLATALRGRGYEVEAVTSAQAAVECFANFAPSLVITELRLPDASGLELLSVLRVNAPSVQVAIVTSWPSIATAVQATKWGAVDYRVKPALIEELLAAVHAEPCTCTPEGLPLSPCHRVPTLQPGLRRLQWEHIQHAVVDAGSIASAARQLGVDRRSLRRTLAKFPVPESGIDEP